MGDSTSIDTRVLDALVNAGLVTVEQLSAVNEAAAAGDVSPGAVLAERGLVTSADLATVLEGEMGIPRVDLSSYAPDEQALRLLPADVARERMILPLFEIEGVLTVVIGEPLDIFEIDALAAELGFEIETVLGDPASVAEAVSRHYGDATETPLSGDGYSEDPPPTPMGEALGEIAVEETLSGSSERDAARASADADQAEGPGPAVAEPLMVEEDILGLSETDQFDQVAETIEQVVDSSVPEGPPAIDLDVLAVADAGKVAVLVTDILSHAVRGGASHIHLLPYKDDFFLVYRVAGRLEKVASAPISMQGALVDGLKNFVRLGSVPATLPALGRAKSRIAEKDLVVTMSAVPTVAGQRVVISFARHGASPRELPALGMSEAETRALQAMLDRGRGILLVCAPVTGGRSSTYYSLLAYAAAVGRTVYSVERFVEYEIPAVAQVLVNPGSPVGASAYFAAGIRQDTDVMAIDSLQSVEDIHLAIEAAGIGRLVIATFSARDIVAGIRRMLDLGVEPDSLAATLTLGVGQRLVRVNCRSCMQEEDTPITEAIPGAPEGMVSHRGSGCPDCGKTGFSGATGIFEVLPVMEPVRARIANGGSTEDIASAAKAAGMRPMVTSGLAKVQEGLVSAEELNRVLRFVE